jgi:geranylgeranyl diphosphate synthase, type II
MYWNDVKEFMNVYLGTISESKLKSIVKYSIEDGKCIRGFIVKNIIETLSSQIVWEPIVAIELIHAASLIIDDLPCMDNDIVRRNKPTTYVKFGERESILTSFYLVSDSLKILMRCINNNKQLFNDNFDMVIKLIDDWCDLLGKNLIVGQLMDLNENVKKILDIDIVHDSKSLIILKTSSLFMFAFILGGIFSGKKINLENYKNMGLHFGILFQLMDDVKDKLTDKTHNNYYLSNGSIKTVYTFENSKAELETLLKSENLETQELRKLISKITEKFYE